MVGAISNWPLSPSTGCALGVERGLRLSTFPAPRRHGAPARAYVSYLITAQFWSLLTNFVGFSLVLIYGKVTLKHLSTKGQAEPWL